MNDNETILEAVFAFIFGHKYYANIVNTRGTGKCEVASFIFTTKEDADRHRRRLDTTRSFLYVETVSFRSRKLYDGQRIKDE